MTEGGNEFAVLSLGANGDAETVLAELYAMAVTDNDALVHQIIVDLVGIGHLGEEEVGLGGIHFLADGQQSEGFNHACTLLQQQFHPFVDLEGVLQGLQGPAPV